jgi:hypothetical protein
VEIGVHKEARVQLDLQVQLEQQVHLVH